MAEKGKKVKSKKPTRPRASSLFANIGVAEAPLKDERMIG